MKYLYVLIILCCIPLNALTVKVIDDNNKPIPYVIAQGEEFSVVSDSLGVVRFPKLRENELIRFHRLGFRETKVKVVDLYAHPYIKLQQIPISTEEFIIKSQAEDSNFRLNTTSKRIEVQALNKSYSAVSDLLKDIPEFDVRGIKLSGEKQTISLGGHKGKHTIIMWDNIILNPTGQEVDLSNIPTNQIESIEIVKNNVSVETGSGGIAGMIIINSIKGQQHNDFSFSQSIGSYNAYKQNINLNLVIRNLNILINNSVIRADNDFEYEYRGKKFIREYNDKNIYNLSADVNYRFNKNRIIYNFRYQKFYKQLPGPVNYLSMYRQASQKGENINNALYYSLQLNFLNIESQLYHSKQKSIYDNTQAPVGFYYAIDENLSTNYGIKTILNTDKNIADYDFSLSIGNEYKESMFEYNDLLYNLNSIDKLSHQINSYFSSFKIMRDLYYVVPQLIMSTRYDNHSDLDDYLSWRLEFNNQVYSVIDFEIKSSLGTSYTVPSFYDLYWKGDSQTNGNPDLKAEESIGWRVEANAKTNPSIGVAIWKNQTKNLIYWYRSNQGWKPGNVQDAEIKNWEAYGSYTFLKNQTIKANYTRIIARDVSKDSEFYGKYIVYTPSWNWNISLDLNLYNFSQSFSYIAQGKQWSTRDQLIKPLKGYEIYNTGTSFSLNFGKIKTQIVYSLYNVFDKKYQNFPYTPEPGRNWEIQLNFKLL